MNGSIFQLDLMTRNVTLLRSERSPLFGLQIYDPQKQQGIGNTIFCIHTKLYVNICYIKDNIFALALFLPEACVGTYLIQKRCMPKSEC